MEIETAESRDAAPVTPVEANESNQSTPSPPPPPNNEIDPNRRLSKGSYHRYQGSFKGQDSPSSRPTTSMNGHPRTYSLGSAPQFLLPPSPPGSPRSSYHSPRLSRSCLTHYTLDGHPIGARPMPTYIHPVRPNPPRLSQVQKAMEGAIVIERRRTKEMEAQEVDMTADQLREVLKRERHRMSQLSAELAKHKTLTVQSQLEAEVLEEGRINLLMRRLEELQLEKGRIINELEQEEEMVSTQ